MFQLPDCAVLCAGAAEGRDSLILKSKDRSLRGLLRRMVFILGEIIGCILFGSNLKCTTRLVLRAIIEHNGGLAN
ncbi:hypothetical protein DBR24_25770 [Pseudomonas sp. HMWF006]|jgi:hypothetical protein|nr:hypothetical protein DBR24_25770 [Pseudomonas sp. HMWF006]PTT60549.1 hypothetical protein DBR26_28980 [Pseudomonas sp. HMWF007]PTT87218.1 hypothetical protein DBR29_20515 [Pseudomonas sp. HMWF005]RON65518.1 hypothetical protein BK669_06340 [Pseudomonas fluorescens]